MNFLNSPQFVKKHGFSLMNLQNMDYTLRDNTCTSHCVSEIRHIPSYGHQLDDSARYGRFECTNRLLFVLKSITIFLVYIAFFF